MKRILLLLLFVVNLQITITDSAIGLRCGAVTHAQTMMREVDYNGGCLYSDDTGWEFWTPIPCALNPVAEYPCTYCGLCHEYDFERDKHQMACGSIIVDYCGNCGQPITRKEYCEKSHGCPEYEYPEVDNDFQSDDDFFGHIDSSGHGNSGGHGCSSSGQGTCSGNCYSWTGGEYMIPTNVQTYIGHLPGKIPRQYWKTDCFPTSWSNLQLLLNARMTEEQWETCHRGFIKNFVEKYEINISIRISGVPGNWLSAHCGEFNLTKISSSSVVDNLKKGIPILAIKKEVNNNGEETKHAVVIVGYDKSNQRNYFYMDPFGDECGEYLFANYTNFVKFFKYNQ